MMFSTHPALSTHDLVVLRDDGRLQPPENVVPAIRSSVVSEYGSSVTAVIDAVTARISTRALRRLNEQVDVFGERASDVAKLSLDEEVAIP